MIFVNDSLSHTTSVKQLNTEPSLFKIQLKIPIYCRHQHRIRHLLLTPNKILPTTFPPTTSSKKYFYNNFILHQIKSAKKLSSFNFYSIDFLRYEVSTITSPTKTLFIFTRSNSSSKLHIWYRWIIIVIIFVHSTLTIFWIQDAVPRAFQFFCPQHVKYLFGSFSALRDCTFKSSWTRIS